MLEPYYLDPNDPWAASMRDCGPAAMASYLRKVLPPSTVPSKIQKLEELIRDVPGKVLILTDSTLKAQVLCSALPLSLPAVAATSNDAVKDFNESKCNRLTAAVEALESSIFEKISSIDFLVCFDIPKDPTRLLQVSDFGKRFRANNCILYDPFDDSQKKTLDEYLKIRATATKSGSLAYFPPVAESKLADKPKVDLAGESVSSAPAEASIVEISQVVAPAIDYKAWKALPPSVDFKLYLTTVTIPKEFYKQSEMTLYMNDFSWGILTLDKPFPERVSASFFVNDSQVPVNFDPSLYPITLTDRQLLYLQRFQRVFFEVALRGSTSQITFDFESDRKMYHVAPLTFASVDSKSVEIDWKLVKDVLEFKREFDPEFDQEFNRELKQMDSAEFLSGDSEQLPLLRKLRDSLLNGKDIEKVSIAKLFSYRGHVDIPEALKDWTEAFCQDSVFITKLNFGVHFGVKVRKDLHPMSPIDFGKPKLGESSLTYYKYFKDKYGIELTNLKQPMIFGRMLKPRNFLKAHKSPKDPVLFQAFIPIEIVEIFPVSVSQLLSSKALPSVLTRFESLTRSFHFRETLRVPWKENFRLEILSKALTSPSADDYYCYETLETVGDAILKLVISADLFAHYYSAEEGELTRRRTKLIQNRALADLSRKLGYHRFLQLKPFSVKSFYFPGCRPKPFVYVDRSSQTKSVKEITSDILSDGNDNVSDNTLADAFESVLGAVAICYEDDAFAWDFLYDQKVALSSFEEVVSKLQDFDFLEFDPTSAVLEDASSVKSEVSSIGGSALAGWRDNPKGALYEYCSRNNIEYPRISVPRSVGKDHDRTFTIKVELFVAKDKVIDGEGKDRSKKSAERLACLEVCKKLFGPEEKSSLSVPSVASEIKLARKMSVDSVISLESWLDSSFKNKSLAFVVLQNNTAYKFCFARLAFLGDAFLDWIFVKWLYQRHPDMSPLAISFWKQEKLSNRHLAVLGCLSDFYTCLKLPDFLLVACKKIKEKPDRDEVPLWLANTVEALIGALAIDKNFDVEKVVESCKPFFKALFGSLEEELKEHFRKEEEKKKAAEEDLTGDWKGKGLSTPTAKLSARSAPFVPGQYKQFQ